MSSRNGAWHAHRAVLNRATKTLALLVALLATSACSDQAGTGSGTTKGSATSSLATTESTVATTGSVRGAPSSCSLQPGWLGDSDSLSFVDFTALGDLGLAESDIRDGRLAQRVSGLSADIACGFEFDGKAAVAHTSEGDCVGRSCQSLSRPPDGAERVFANM